MLEPGASGEPLRREKSLFDARKRVIDLPGLGGIQRGARNGAERLRGARGGSGKARGGVQNRLHAVFVRLTGGTGAREYIRRGVLDLRGGGQIIERQDVGLVEPQRNRAENPRQRDVIAKRGI